MSDWEKVVQFVNNSGYYIETSLNIIVANIILHWEGENEESGMSLDTYLEDCVAHDFESYDYD